MQNNATNNKKCLTKRQYNGTIIKMNTGGTAMSVTVKIKNKTSYAGSGLAGSFLFN